jgi:hypothetical protein
MSRCIPLRPNERKRDRGKFVFAKFGTLFYYRPRCVCFAHKTVVHPLPSDNHQDEVPSSRSGFGAVYAVAHGSVYCGLVQYHYQYLHPQLAGT